MTRQAMVLWLKPSNEFVRTPFIDAVTDRALSYIRAGFPVHLSGPSGTGKTSLAIHVAAQLGRHALLICGDDEFSTSDLVGRSHGYHRRRVVDNFIHSVLRTEENMAYHWIDNRLTVACQEGYTLIYDEFTRSRPEANNALLSVLEEGILALPAAESSQGYVPVHPNFTAIFTSNPDEYAGVHSSPDALLDRMVTVDLREFDEETELAIVAARTGGEQAIVRRVVALVRHFRRQVGYGGKPTVRAGIVIGRVLRMHKMTACADDPLFRQVCAEAILPQVRGHTSNNGRDRDGRHAARLLEKLLFEHCPTNGSRGDGREEEILCPVTSVASTI